MMTPEDGRITIEFTADINEVGHKLVLQCLVDVLDYYTKDPDVDVRVSIQNTLTALEGIYGLARVLPVEPTGDPLYWPVMAEEEAEEAEESLMEMDRLALERWNKASRRAKDENRTTPRN